MQLPLLQSRKPVPAGYGVVFGEGRRSESARRMTGRVLFPRGDVIPGPWLLLLASVCTFVAVRALELGVL